MTGIPHHDPSMLRCCLVDEEGAALRSPSRRRLSMIVSATLQVALLGTMLLVPLLVGGEKLRTTIFVAPIPVYHRVPHSAMKAMPPETPVKPPGSRKPAGIYQPPAIPERVLEIHEPPAPPEISVPTGPAIPGSIEGPPGAGAPNIAIVNPPTSTRPPALEPQPRPFMRSELLEGKLIHRVQPQYPVVAKQIRLQGTVRLRAVIGRDGSVREVEILDGPPLLALAARDAVTQWRYQPTLLNGRPVEVETHITVHFRLQ